MIVDVTEEAAATLQFDCVVTAVPKYTCGIVVGVK